MTTPTDDTTDQVSGPEAGEPEGTDSAGELALDAPPGDVAEAGGAGADHDVVLVCNPRAGGRWRALADILDSEEARSVRRIVTDAIADIAPAVNELGRGTQLLCIYGGDGTIQRILDHMWLTPRKRDPQLAFIGGGTMNVAARWCGMRGRPGENFQRVIRAYQSDQLLLREVPLLKVAQGEAVHYGFTFGMGPLVRILRAYEVGTKGKAAALAIAAKSAAAVWTGKPLDFQPVLREMNAEIVRDGQVIPYSRFTAVFANITGKLHIGVEPFLKRRQRGTFFCAAYAIDPRELVALLPFIARGHLPLQPTSLITELSTWKQVALSFLGRGTFPTDPRYTNDVASRFEVRSDEEVYTVDGEVIESTGEPIRVTLGPTVRLAVSPTAGLGATARVAAGVAEGVTGGAL